ncbi:MAG: hypothetical protein HZT40_01025 [Candidatus Thiothrix singaporensis]|uniref:Oxidoreductase-like domain-containing protein n=1 Tax=Candidatus Thiothrix singaporensis TaxID=2799669 RepID=A0A7L6AMZ5_9GAMM|nr:MAG: hypothetical protein HZT40_01025 [Candidatus Thiothrix singaporensis]
MYSFEGANTMREKPEPPADNECCDSGCDPCVWDIYRKELEKWNRIQQRKQQEKSDKPEEQSS